MLFDMKAYDTINTYMDHYKGLTDDINRHCPVDTFYILDKSHLVIVVNHKDFKLIRPETHRRVFIIHKDNLMNIMSKSNTMVLPDQSFYDPKDNRLKFIKNKTPFFHKFHFEQHLDRFYGTHPNKLTRINYNWFFDRENKCINYVISGPLTND